MISGSEAKLDAALTIAYAREGRRGAICPITDISIHPLVIVVQDLNLLNGQVPQALYVETCRHILIVHSDWDHDWVGAIGYDLVNYHLLHSFLPSVLSVLPGPLVSRICGHFFGVDFVSLTSTDRCVIIRLSKNRRGKNDEQQARDCAKKSVHDEVSLKDSGSESRTSDKFHPILPLIFLKKEELFP
jgi:hypothetical protein